VIQGDPSLLCSPLNDGLSLLIIGDHIDVCYLVYQFWYLLIAPCELVSQAPSGVYLFKSGLSNFFTFPCRSDLYLSLVGDLNIGQNRGVGYRLVTYLLVDCRTVDFLLWRFVTSDVASASCPSDSLVLRPPSAPVSFCETSLS
jgi:hypothetical protein